jgi:hypothetical protein
MVLLFAVLLFSHVIPADASLTTVYQQSFEMAGKTYIQGADSLEAGINNFGSSIDPNSSEKPAEQKSQEGEQKPTYVNGGPAR